MQSDGSGSRDVFSFSSLVSFEDQYRAAMEAVVLLDRSHSAGVEAVGSDRDGFLHNMLSADIKGLALSAGTRATFLTVKGKLVSDLNVFKEADRILLEMESARVEALVAALSRYIISEDVTLSSLQEDEATFSLEGPGASAVLSGLIGSSLQELDALGDLETRSVGGSRVVAHRSESSPRFDLAASPDGAREYWNRAIEAGAIVGSEQLAETRRIEAGRPRFGIDMDDTHMPLEAGLDDAIDFEKGCYIGQEYVVRLAHRGHVNRKLVGLILETEDPPAKGTPVEVGGRAAGQLTSAAHSLGLGCVVALGYLKRDYFEPGTEVSVHGHPGRVSSLPFQL